MKRFIYLIMLVMMLCAAAAALASCGGKSRIICTTPVGWDGKGIQERRRKEDPWHDDRVASRRVTIQQLY